MKLRFFVLIPALLLASGLACAHVGDHGSASFFSGFMHPFGGLDHLLAMLAVGVFAIRQGGRSRWGLPLAFVMAMLAGAGLSALGVALPMVETGIASSVLVLGLLIASLVKLPIVASLPLVAGFAVFHGYAHHVEMGDTSLAWYTSGFLLATAALHGLGLLIGRWLPETAAGSVVRRVAGLVVAGVGASMLIG